MNLLFQLTYKTRKKGAERVAEFGTLSGIRMQVVVLTAGVQEDMLDGLKTILEDNALQANAITPDQLHAAINEQFEATGINEALHSLRN